MKWMAATTITTLAAITEEREALLGERKQDSRKTTEGKKAKRKMKRKVLRVE